MNSFGVLLCAYHCFIYFRWWKYNQGDWTYNSRRFLRTLWSSLVSMLIFNKSNSHGVQCCGAYYLGSLDSNLRGLCHERVCLKWLRDVVKLTFILSNVKQHSWLSRVVYKWLIVLFIYSSHFRYCVLDALCFLWIDVYKVLDLFLFLHVC